jgi:flagellar hook-associated protein 3 FlgL
MSMRVTFNGAFVHSMQDIKEAARRVSEWQRQVSSGQRIQQPSDDPSAAAAVVGERTEMGLLDQYRETTDSVESRLLVVDSYLSDLIANLTVAQTTAAAGRSTILPPNQRQALASQLRGIRDTLLQDFNGQYRGTYLFSGTDTLTRPFSKDGSGTVQPYAGNANSQRLDIDRNRGVDVTLDGGAVAGDVFDVIASLADAVEAGDMTQVDAGLQGLAAAFDRFTGAQSRVGVALGDLDEHRLRLGAASRSADQRRSSLEDANLAEAVSRMQQADTAYRAALTALAGAGRLSLMDYLR